ncbi:unnamed protein product [Macrosiphum euphorbiae]|uniref:Uncharacterized protein n=1 Tax=Macrosiphum euphorbiae TaxID=13131 RepID=A0AAV0WS46_9HEMI|nr:unnamed protein product [Macrosiphum euphorbiae]
MSGVGTSSAPARQLDVRSKASRSTGIVQALAMSGFSRALSDSLGIRFLNPSIAGIHNKWCPASIDARTGLLPRHDLC